MVPIQPQFVPVGITMGYRIHNMIGNVRPRKLSKVDVECVCSMLSISKLFYKTCLSVLLSLRRQHHTNFQFYYHLLTIIIPTTLVLLQQLQ